MSSLSEEAYIAQRRDALRIQDGLAKYCALQRIYNPGAQISSQSEFDPPEVSITRALDAIRASRALVMLYTLEKPSSVLVEAGCALAQRIPSLYFVRRPFKLPFLLTAATVAFEDVRLYEYDDIEDVLEYIRTSAPEFFKGRVVNP